MAVRTKMDAGTSKPKYRYRVTNWAEYDRALVSRGDLTIWFDEATIKDAMLSTLAYSPCEPYGKRVKWRSLSH